MAVLLIAEPGEALAAGAAWTFWGAEAESVVAAITGPTAAATAKALIAITRRVFIEATIAFRGWAEGVYTITCGGGLRSKVVAAGLF